MYHFSVKQAFILVITTLCSATYCKNWRFNIVNMSPYHFQNSDVSAKNNLDQIPPNLRPFTAQNLELRFRATNNLLIEYGSRLKLHFSKGADNVELEDVEHDTSISYTYDSYFHTLVIRAIDPEIYEFSFIVSSDPQPYRLDNDGDPNAQRFLWLESTKPVFRHIAEEETDAHLMIVNGDLTEFGRSTQMKTFLHAVSAIRTPMLCGLGNHDYENNVEDCTDLDPKSDSPRHNPVKTDSSLNESSSNWFPPNQLEWVGTNIKKLLEKVKSYSYPEYFKRLKNLCARRMIQRMRDHESYLVNLLPDFSSDDESLAYAWNYGSHLRFVQLHNRPDYTVKLPGFFSSTVVIKDSLDWLIVDMDTFKNRSYVINVHDASSFSDLEKLRPYFGRIKAIFAGHTHEAGIQCVKGISVFDSGALFKNEFLRVNFSQDGRCFDVLHFAEDQYLSPLAVNYCFQSILENPCKYN